MGTAAVIIPPPPRRPLAYGAVITQPPPPRSAASVCLFCLVHAKLYKLRRKSVQALLDESGALAAKTKERGGSQANSRVRDTKNIFQCKLEFR